MNAHHPIVSTLKEQLSNCGIVQSTAEKAAEIASKSGIIYQHPVSKFWVRREGGGFVAVPYNAFKDALTAANVMPPDLEDKEIGPLIEAIRATVIGTHSVDGVVNLAGYPTGVTTLHDGMIVLVPRGMEVLKPVKGDPTPLLSFISNLMGGDGPPFQVLLSWLRRLVLDAQICAEVGPVKANVRQSQMMIMIGEPNCGKTFLFSLLGNIVGNKKANPYPYFAGDTAFNAELAEAVILMIDDQAESVQPRHRQRLTQRIKEYLVADVQRAHPKGQQAFHVNTFQRIVMLANEDSLGSMPRLDPSFMDKVILLKAHRSELVSRKRSDDERTSWRETLVASLPAFVHYLINEFEIPEELKDSRYGIKAYHDKALLGEINGIDDHGELLRALCSLYKTTTLDDKGGKITTEEDPSNPKTYRAVWEGSSRQFQGIVNHLPVEEGWRNLFKHTNSAGMLLANLAREFPAQVTAAGTVNGYKRWRIDLGEPIILPKGKPRSTFPIDDD